MRKMSQIGIDLIKKWEGLGDGDRNRPGLQPYMDPVGIWTIGYGHAITVNGRFLRGSRSRSTAEKIYNGGLTLQQAEDLLREDVRRFEIGVNNLVSANTSQNEFDAFVSLAFNIGLGAFRRSSALRYHNMGRKDLVPRKIQLWNKAGGRTLRGLVNRRKDESRLYEGK